MKMFRNIADIGICLIGIITFWFMWPLSLLRKSLGLHFIHFIVVFVLVGLVLVNIFWNYERFCSHSRAGFLSPTDGEIVRISKITQASGEEYHVISISQRTFGARAFFAPLDGRIIQVAPLLPQDASVEVKLPGILRKIFGEQAVLSRRITIKSQDGLDNECFISVFCGIGIPFVSVANDNFKVGSVFGSSNFCPFGASVNYYIPVSKSGSLVCAVGQTVIGGETTLVEKLSNTSKESRMIDDGNQSDVIDENQSKERMADENQSKERMADENQSKERMADENQSKERMADGSQSTLVSTNLSEESKNEEVGSKWELATSNQSVSIPSSPTLPTPGSKVVDPVIQNQILSKKISSSGKNK